MATKIATMQITQNNTYQLLLISRNNWAEHITHEFTQHIIA